MLQVEDGRLSLADPLTKFFPDAPETWSLITVRHLLTHTSGIKDWEGKTDLDYRKDYTEDELVQVAMKLDKEMLWSTLSRFGAGHLTSSGYPGESAGMLPPFQGWRAIRAGTEERCISGPRRRVGRGRRRLGRDWLRRRPVQCRHRLVHRHHRDRGRRPKLDARRRDNDLPDVGELRFGR